MKQLHFCIRLGLLLITACAAPSVQKLPDGVVVHLYSSSTNAVRQVRLQVVADDIIHVTATPDDHFPEEKSLIAAYPATKTQGWEVTTAADEVVLQTATLKVRISKATGEVCFTDLQDSVLLRENAGGGKSFEPILVDGYHAYSLRQVFESPEDEAFYGLGQHQSDEFNYKGKSESLYQYNTKVSVPFLVSSKRYAILWDCYSLTKFGDPRDYAQLHQFALTGKDGKESGLTATYMVNGEASNPFVTRQESAIDYENLETAGNFPKNFPLYGSTVTWEGYMEPKESGLFRFILYYAGYAKVYLDDSLVVAERWRTAWNPNNYKFTASLKKGRKHKFKLEWKPDGGVSYIGLKALSPASPSEQNTLSLWSEMGRQISYYFIKGEKMDDLIKGYRTVTGKAQVMPKWAMGFWQSKERYKTQDEVLSTLREFRRRRIPIDNIVQDWSYWPENAWGSHDFDSVRFPNPEAMVDEVHAMNARIMISVWPKFYHTTQHYKEFDEKGWMYRQAVKDSVKDWIGQGYVGSFYDAYSEGARELFWRQMNDKLYSKGFDAWWMDASEPDILSNASISYRKALMNPTAIGSSSEYFNAFGLMNAKGIYEGQRKADGESRVFLLTRSGFAGSQKYAAAIWSGDISARWEDMKAQISAGLNFSISGNPYWTMDNGGFCVEKRYAQAQESSPDRDEWRELNVRWHQFGAFAPLYRTHGQFPAREVWNIAPESHPAYKTILSYTQLRYRLMPYIYTLAGMVHFGDYTIMRPLVMDFATDKNVLNVGDQYMFGPHLMVCPVYRYKARSRDVYFPANTGWYEYASGKYIEGGQRATVEAPYEQMPLYVRAGSILPTGNLIQHTREAQTDITLKVYTGADGEFTLYEDEEVNYGYEKGAYATIRFVYDEALKSLVIEERRGEFPGMAKERVFNVEWRLKDGKAAATKVKYNGYKVAVKIPQPYTNIINS
jgi:alpha-D-xyloside xylohydrolase